MKSLKYAVILLLGLSMVIMASCTKDPNNGGNGGGNTYNGHEYVDLGLPSGTLWATCNVGATTPEGCGDLFAWGETTPKSSYTCDNYKYGNGSWDSGYYDKLTKYCCQAEYGYNGFIDSLTTLEAMDDAATANWGNGWRTPTKEEWMELCEYTTQVGSFQNNVSGMLFTSANGKSIFIPFAPDDDEILLWTDRLDYHFPSWLYPDGRGYSCEAICVDVWSDWGTDRCRGLEVRPVRSNR